MCAVVFPCAAYLVQANFQPTQCCAQSALVGSSPDAWAGNLVATKFSVDVDQDSWVIRLVKGSGRGARWELGTTTTGDLQIDTLFH